jgi:hypothetical protein
MRIAILVSLSLIMWTAAGSTKTLRSIRTIGILTGSCQRLIGFGDDVTDRCSEKVINTEWSDGRDSFAFSSLDGSLILTFSGDGRAQIKQGPDTAVQPLDGIIATINGKSQTIRAVGSCRFSNPYKGPVPIVCDAETPGGDFSATFKTDGSNPEIKHFQ